MARVLKGSHSLSAHPHVHTLSEWSVIAFALPAVAGTPLPTPKRWKAELAWVAGYVGRKYLSEGSHPSHS